MKNGLQTFLERNKIAETWAMNQLQGAGIVADNAETAADVAETDTKRAVFFLAGIKEQVFERFIAGK